jgi:N-acetylglucosamine-6-sulfatase
MFTRSVLRRAALVLLAIVLAATACTGSPSRQQKSPTSGIESGTVGSGPGAPAPHARPDIVLILTDDQTLAELGHMATVRSELQGKGMTLRNGFVVNPLCCPSRTSILTGRYSHSTRVYRNGPPYGGFQTFGSQDRSTIATWLHDAGYATALVGKYLNGYTLATYVPPGWDTWDAFSYIGYYRFQLSRNGHAVGFEPRRATGYSTMVLGADAVRFIRSVPPSHPLFLYFAPNAPHLAATPEIKYQNALASLPPYRPQNFNEADVSDKPMWLRQTPPLTSSEVAENDLFVRHQLETLLSVDDQIRNILTALQETGRLSNTFILFASDNGLENGAHRLQHKGVPYEESIHVPMVVRYDPLTRLHPSTSDLFALNVDVAPTFAALAGIRAPGAEGTSLMPVLENDAAGWRTEFVIEHMEQDPGKEAPTFCAVRTARYKYVEYTSGEIELYDLSVDPNELHNVAGSPELAAIQAKLRADDARLCSPRPPGWPS